MSQVLSVTLPSSTLHVSGTVNSETTVWTNTSGLIWEATVPRAANDTYYVELTLVATSGATSVVTFTLYYGLQLITNRTKADVLAGNEKGIYTASDLNRVGAAILYVRDRFHEQGYMPDVNPRTDWTDAEWLTPATAAEYLGMVETLRSQFSVMYTTPETPPDLEGFTFEEANNIEQILEDLDYLLTMAQLSWFYSGEIYGGEI